MKKPSKLHLFFYKLKNYGKPKTYCEAIANYYGNMEFAFFYDVDGELKPETYKVLKQYANGNYGIFKTKHGHQIIIYYRFSLHDIYKLFTIFYKIYHSDYYFTIPLWLRTSAKYDETGKEISPAPLLVDGVDKRNIFKVKKIYQTWD